MDYSTLIAKRTERLTKVESLISEPGFFDDQKAASEIMREHRGLKNLITNWDELQNLERNLAENQELLKEDDPEIIAMVEEEIPVIQSKIEKIQAEVQYALLPKDVAEERDALIEIRAGAGGDEASLFAGELMKLYNRYSERNGWKTELLDASASEVGGFKEVVLKVSGNEVFRYLKYESGVHRVQRVPATETQGRIHTSTVTVAVMPEAQEVDIEIKPEDLDIQTCRSGGAGGQHVNKTESAVQITYKPTGLMVRCEDGRSQTMNREKGMQILRAKLYEAKKREEEAKHAAQRKSLVGSGDRSEKIRTYNFPQSRVTDHRINHTSHNMEHILDGQIHEFTEQLQKADMEMRLEQAENMSL